MKVTIEDLSFIRKKILVEIPLENVKKAVDDEYKYLQKNTNIHGFRKGHIPRQILERHYKKDVEANVKTKLIDDSYPVLIKENEIPVVARPDIENTSEIKDGLPFTYTATVEVRPVLKIEGYKDIKVKGEDVSVSAEEIDDIINSMREKHAVFKDIEGEVGARDGHLVSVEFSGTMDDKPIEGAAAKNYSFVIGSGTLLKDLEDAFIGMKKGTERSVDVKFPETYKNKTIAGKTGNFKISLKEIKEKILPELNDEFAKDADYENMEQLREKVKADLLRYKTKGEEERIKKEIVTELIAKNKFEVPQSLVEHYYKYLIMQVYESLEKGLVFKEDMELSHEKFTAKYAKMAEDLVRQDIIVDSIAKEQGFAISDNELDDKIRELAEIAKEPFEALKSRMEKEERIEKIKEGLLEDKVFAMMLSNRR